MNKKYTFLSIVTAALLVFSLFVPTFAADIPPEQGADYSGQTIILHTNDVHGHASDNMGYAAVAALKAEYEDAGAEVILLDAGDIFHGMPFATLSEGEDVANVLNEVGYDAALPGNHDFNYGIEQLTELVGMLEFPFLSSNVLDKSTGEPLFDQNVILEKNGVSYGIFSITTPDTAYETSPEHVADIEFEDPAKTAKQQIDKLKEAGAEFIIALTHLGVDHSSGYSSDLLAADVPEIDLIIDGHSHTAMSGGEPLDDTIELLPHGGTVIASTGAFIENIGVVTIDGDEIDARLADADAFTGQDEKVAAMVAKITAGQDAILSEVLGTTRVLLDGERENVRTKETNLGDLSSDAFRQSAGADVCITNGGNIRASIQPGDITQNDLITVYPFGNYIVVLEITGDVLLEALEHGVSAYPEDAGGFPQVSGVSFTFDPEKDAGSRITEAKVGGKPLEKNATYTIAISDFLHSGGDDYTMFTDLPVVRYGASYHEILTEFIAANPNIEYETDGRITISGEAAGASENTASESANQESAPEKPAASGTYTIKRGDSLWKIAGAELGDAHRWPEIYELNKDDIANPDLIEIGQQLKLPAA